MWTMACDAPFFAKQRPVHPVFSHNSAHLLRMALLAKSVSFFLELKRSGRTLAFMALAAHPRGHGRMYIVIQYARLVGAVGVMAQSTLGILHGVVVMLFCHLRIIQLMTAQTKHRHGLFEQKIRRSRTMRRMAVCASFIYRPMLELDRRNLFFLALVTLETDIIACLEQMERIFRSMGVVAQGTFALIHGLMSALCASRNPVRVTREAELTDAGGQELAMIGSMWTMAGGAVAPLFYSRMHIGIFQLVSDISVASQANLLPCIRLQKETSVICIRLQKETSVISARCNRTGQKENGRQEGKKRFIRPHLYPSFHFFTTTWQRPHSPASNGGCSFFFINLASFAEP